MLFHEASHTLAAPLRNATERACTGAGKTSPTLWHAVLFYLTGAAVGRAVGDAYVPYAERNGLYERGDWTGLAPLLTRHLHPYVEGARPLDAALADLCAALP